jgi:hypothetical protein
LDRERGVWQHRERGGTITVESSPRLRTGEAEQHTPEYRTVAVYWTVPEAELARGLLVSDGIPVAFLDAADAALLPGTAPVRLLVPACDLDRSRLLLDPVDVPTVSAEATAAPGIGALDAAWSKLALALVGLAALLAGLLVL